MVAVLIVCFDTGAEVDFMCVPVFVFDCLCLCLCLTVYACLSVSLFSSSPSVSLIPRSLLVSVRMSDASIPAELNVPPAWGPAEQSFGRGQATAAEGLRHRGGR